MTPLPRALNLLRGDPSADRAVPPSGTTGHLTVLGAAAMGVLAVFALCFAMAAGRVADKWSASLDRNAVVEISVPDPDRADALSARVLSAFRRHGG